jgi:uncharacterized protein YuzE
MKATYDARTDTQHHLAIRCCRRRKRRGQKAGVVLDYDEDGKLVSLEILDASQRVTEPRRIEFETVG